jgi:hypothetical protein
MPPAWVHSFRLSSGTGSLSIKLLLFKNLPQVWNLREVLAAGYIKTYLAGV